MKQAAVLKLSYMPSVSVSVTSCRGLELCVSTGSRGVSLVPTDSSFPPAFENRGPSSPSIPRWLFEAAPRRSACVVLTARGAQAAGHKI